MPTAAARLRPRLKPRALGARHRGGCGRGVPRLRRADGKIVPADAWHDRGGPNRARHCGEAAEIVDQPRVECDSDPLGKSSNSFHSQRSGSGEIHPVVGTAVFAFYGDNGLFRSCACLAHFSFLCQLTPTHTCTGRLHILTKTRIHNALASLTFEAPTSAASAL